MLKKSSIGILVLLVLALGLVGTALAQEPTPPTGSVCPYGGTCGGSTEMGGFGYRGTMPTLLADALGMTSEELYAALSDGQTIAELAQAQGVEMDALLEALIAPRIEQLDLAVAGGYMTQEQADWMIEMMTTQMAWRLESYGLGYGGHGGYGGGGCGMIGGGGSYGGRQGGRMGGRWQSTPSTGTDL